MNRFLLIAVLCIVNFVGASSQKSISPFHHPEPNDSFFYKVDRLPEYISLETSGESPTWNFRSLRSPFVNTIVFKEYNSEMMDLPLLAYADLVTVENSKFRNIYSHDSDGLHILGQMIDPTFDNQNISYSTYYGQSSILRSSYAIGDVGSYIYEKETIIEGFEFTDALKSCLGGEVERFKLHFQYNVDYEVDKAGTLILPSIRAEVLREKQKIRETAYYSFYRNGDWYLIDDKEGLDSLFSKQPLTKTQVYISKESHLPLAVINTSEFDEILEIKYQIDPSIERDVIPSNERTITATPNPTFGITRFEFLGYPNDTYTIEIISTIGKKIWSESFYLSDNEPIKVDFSFLDKGTYLYTIKDESGKNLSTKRLVIINP